MSNVVVGARIQVDGAGAAESVGSVKKQLKEAKEELIQLQDKFGALSPAAIEAAKRVAGLKDQIKEAAEVSDLFDPGAKFKTLASAASLAVSGVGAVQGVMALLGEEGQAVQETIMKMHAVMAISDGFSAIADGAKDFQRLSTMIQQSTVFTKANDAATKAAAFTMKLFGGSVETTATSFKVLKGAMAALGIGAIIFAVTELVSWFQSLTSAAEEAAEAEKKALQARAESDKADYDGQMAFVNREEKLAIARLKAAGKSEQDIYNERVRWQKQRIAAAQETNQKQEDIDQAELDLKVMRIEEEGRIREEAEKKAKEAADRAAQQAKQQREERKRQAEQEQREQQQRISDAKKQNDELRSINEAEGAGSPLQKDVAKLRQEFEEKKAILQAGGQSLVDLNIWWESQQANIKKKYRDEELAEDLKKRDEINRREEEERQKIAENQKQRVDSIGAAIRAVIDLENTSFQERRDLLNGSEQTLMADTTLTEQQKTLLAAQFAQARIDIDKGEAAAKQRNMDVLSGALSTFSDVVGKQTAVGKVLGIASATISTYKAASMALATYPPPFSYIAAAGAVAAGLKNVREIMKVQVPGGGGSAGPSLSGASMQAPLMPQSTSTQLNQDSINAIGNAAGNVAVRTFVLESDVNDSQERQARLNRAARLAGYLLPILFCIGAFV